ncbi:hypothetical protein [Paraburkholderia aromaticivorans]|uniref:hypothetical protein n=1 Tax=Paraburkholderia aromaticivorans TaxID=2026199 RepID=UPI00145605D8
MSLFMMVRQSKVGEQALSATPSAIAQASVLKTARALDNGGVAPTDQSLVSIRRGGRLKKRPVERLAEVRQDGI